MKRYTKIIISIVLVVVLAAAFCGCQPLVSGKSAYEIAVDNGFVGTEAQWLESLKGEKGANGLDGKDGENFNADYTLKEVYDEMVAYGGYTGSFEDFVLEVYLGIVENRPSADDSQVIAKCLRSACSIVAGHLSVTGGYSYSAGAGVIYSCDKETGDAFIVTNYHVVYSDTSTAADKIATDITAMVYGSEYIDSPFAMKCTFVGGSSVYDIAVLSVKNSDAIKNLDIEAAKFADSNQINLGQAVYAIGNPEGDGISVSKGVLSVDSEYLTMNAIVGSGEVEMRVIRYDAAVSPGNSGGGLFNADGEVIGIVNAKSVATDVDNMNYAIPSNIAVAVAEHIIDQCLNTNKTSISKALLGITVKEENSKAVYNSTTGTVKIEAQVLIDAIENTSVANGILKVGDRILTVSRSGQKIEITRNFMIVDVVLSSKVGDKLVFEVVRNGQIIEKTVEITERCMVSVQ